MLLTLQGNDNILPPRVAGRRHRKGPRRIFVESHSTQMPARTLVKDQQSEQLFYKWTVSRHEDVAPKVNLHTGWLWGNTSFLKNPGCSPLRGSIPLEIFVMIDNFSL